MTEPDINSRGQVLVYEAEDGGIRLDVRLEDELFLGATCKEFLQVQYDEKFRQRALREPTEVEWHFIEAEKKLKQIEEGK